MNKFKMVIVVAVTGLVGAIVAPALAAITVPSPPAVTLPTIPVLPTVPGATTIPQPPNPAQPPAINTTNLGAVLQAQIANLAAALQTTPAALLAQVLNTTIPTPDGAVSTVSMTVQEYIDRLASHAIIGGTNTGVLGTPEVAIGSIVHQYSFARTFKASTTPRSLGTMADVKAALPHYSVAASPYLVSTPSTVSYMLTAALVPAVVNPALCALLTPPTTTPAPSSCKITVPATVPVTLPTAIPASPIPPGTVSPALVPKLPALVFNHMGGPLVSVQGDGWDARSDTATMSETGFSTWGAKHTGGNSTYGTNVDTHPRTVDTTAGALDPWAIYVPLFTSNTEVGAAPTAADAPSGGSVDFMGFASLSDTRTCYKSAATTANLLDTEAKFSTAVASGVPIICTAIGSLTGDGVANFGGWPLDLRQDLSILWGPSPTTTVDVANAAISAMIAALPTSLLQAYGLGLESVYAAYITGKLAKWTPFPLPATPPTTIPTTPTVP